MISLYFTVQAYLSVELSARKNGTLVWNRSRVPG